MNTFDSSWEFVSETCSSRVDFSKKLNQWKHQYNLAIVDVRAYDNHTVDFTIARQERSKLPK